ncbi:MAG: hypothetical protein HC938_17015 [Nitrospira sp.]|nr:hypothetical protein [Nitrospira sp.]
MTKPARAAGGSVFINGMTAATIADQVTYDRQSGLLVATGNVEVLYQGRVLRASRITYDEAADQMRSTVSQSAPIHGAVLPTPGTKPHINSVNSTENPSLFIDNAGATYNTQMDAFTVTIPVVFDVIAALSGAFVAAALQNPWVLAAFAAIFAATGGGPGSATEILNLYAYRLSFTELSLGYGAAVATVLLVITLLGLVGTFLTSYTRARAESLGLDAKVGLLQRPERITLLERLATQQSPEAGPRNSIV